MDPVSSDLRVNECPWEKLYAMLMLEFRRTNKKYKDFHH